MPFYVLYYKNGKEKQMITLKCAFCGCVEKVTEEDYQELLSFGGPFCPDCLEYKAKRAVTMDKIK